MTYNIVPLRQEHVDQVMKIFNYYIENDYSAYFDHPYPAEFTQALSDTPENLPALVVLSGSDVVGFALLRSFHPSHVFSSTAEITYFIHPDHTRRGLGKQLLARLVASAWDNGYKNIVASISSRNQPSIAFHERNGFRHCGRLVGVGQKFGQDFDVVLMQLTIDGKA